MFNIILTVRGYVVTKQLCQFVFVMKTDCVICEAKTECLSIIDNLPVIFHWDLNFELFFWILTSKTIQILGQLSQTELFFFSFIKLSE